MAIYAIAILIRAAPLDPQCNLKKIWHPKLEKNGQPVFGPDSDPIFGPRFSRWCSGNVKEDQGKSNLRTCTVFSPVTLKSNFSWSCSERLTTFRKWSALTPSNQIQNIKKILGQIFTKSQEPGYSQENSHVHS